MRQISHQKLRWIMGLLVVTLTGLLLGACGAESQRTYTIGIVSLVELPDLMAGIKSGMAEMGYVEGQNITYIYEGPAGTPDALEPMVERLLEAQVDLIISITTPATLVAKKLTAGTAVPVVFAPIVDPVQAGIVPSLKQPGGNLTGVTIGGSEGRRLEWLKQLSPELKRAYLPYNPNDPATVTGLAAMKASAAQLQIELVTRETFSPEDVEQALKDAPRDVDAIILLADSLVATRAQDFARLAIERRVPLTSPNTVELGALMAFGSNFTTVGKQTARLVDKIFKGSPPSEIPVETAEFFLQINLKSAAAIGLSIPDSILQQAHTVVR